LPGEDITPYAPVEDHQFAIDRESGAKPCVGDAFFKVRDERPVPLNFADGAAVCDDVWLLSSALLCG
jgi:hypothetical protein